MVNADFLVQYSVDPSERPLTDEAKALLSDARIRAKNVQCFDFVPSNYENAWAILDALPRGTLCEWGSGLGVVVGLAELLGYQATGIELDSELSEQSRELLADHSCSALIRTGSYLESNQEFDYYYVYGWPGKRIEIEEHFIRIAPENARLLICYGQDDLRCMGQSSQSKNK